LYLKPAIESLHNVTKGTEAGKVFHEFARCCDQQLQDRDSLEDFQRLQSLRERKLQEARALEKMYKSTSKDDDEKRREISRSLQKASSWYRLDDEEYKRAVIARAEFANQSLENHLKSLTACEEYDNCVVRFFALWLEHSDSASANAAVAQQLDKVPSWKFVILLNQMSSRLMDEQSTFQVLLSRLLRRLCVDHPYHSIHHIFASCNTNILESDEVAHARKKAALKVFNAVHNDKRVGGLCGKVWEASKLYHELASATMPKTKSSKLSLSKVPVASRMNTRVSQLRIPPATLSLELRPAGDYSQVPTIARFREEISIATGLSAPKILTARATDGNQYKQLVSLLGPTLDTLG